MSERTPLLADNASANGTSPILHEAQPSAVSFNGTLVGSSSILSTAPSDQNSQEPLVRNWVPDPDSKEEVGRARTLIVCLDGTGDQFDDDNSNVIQFLSCLKKDNQKQQLVYYQSGIGTYTSSSFVTPLTNQISKTLDEMFAWNLASHVQDAYQFLMQNYTTGDKISIFGFSRGAYTARSLAGMIQKVGLLPPYNIQQIPFAWAMYARDDQDGLRNSEGFKKTFSTDVGVDFVGVWDTVASVGVTNKELPFVGNNTAIRVFRHAIALDEHRAKFMPNFYHASDNAEPLKATSATSDFTVPPSLVPGSSNGLTKERKNPKKIQRHRSETQVWEDAMNSRGKPTDALEVWFAGCHCDVGGGSVKNQTRHSLARIPLRWMIRECFRTQTGIVFDKDMLKTVIGLDADRLYPTVLPRPARRIPSGSAKINQPESQGFAITTIFKLIGGLLVLPLKFLFEIVFWPIKHFWLLVKFTKPLKWVRRLLNKANHATTANKDALPPVPIVSKADVDCSGCMNEEDEELEDALSPEYDQLAARWFWWIIEYLPMKHRNQQGKRDDYFVRANLGCGRKIYGDARKNGLKIHRSVKTRLEVLDRKGRSVYQPRAWFKHRNAITGKKITGPQEWNIDHPDPRTQWEWVE